MSLPGRLRREGTTHMCDECADIKRRLADVERERDEARAALREATEGRA